MHQFLATYSSLVIDSAAWMVGSSLSDSLLYYAVPQLHQSWCKNPSAIPSPYKKFFFLTVQISLVGTCIAAYLAAPAIFLSLFAAHPSAAVIHAIALNCFQGFLIECTFKLGDCLIKQANGNYTPNQEIREKSIWMLNLSTTTILVAGILWQVHYTKIVFTQLVIDRATQHLYDFNPYVADQITIHLASTRAIQWAVLLANQKHNMQQVIFNKAHHWSTIARRTLGIN